jgi:hypothetical protein
MKLEMKLDLILLHSYSLLLYLLPVHMLRSFLKPLKTASRGPIPLNKAPL